jgi:N-acetyl-gamma-glutamyl-phosphate reductase
MLKVAIAGGSGYGGVELIGILLRHPQVEIVALSSEKSAGKPVSDLYPHLRGLVPLSFSSLEDTLGAPADLLILALPHGEALRIVPGLPRDLPLIDLSGDFRIRDPKVFEDYYGIPMSAPEYQRDFVYGLPEINRRSVRRARRVANPGCFATATLVALYPLYREGWIDGPVFVDSKTGSSGSGRTPSSRTHHPRRSHSLFPYKAFSHQHLPEMRQLLDRQDNPLIFQAHSTPLVRGIFASHYMKLTVRRSLDQVRELYRDYYQNEYFIRWVPDAPDVGAVQHSNFVDLGAATDGDHLVVWSALDNLQKGAAGQAVQNLNLMFGFDERTALDYAPQFP